ncbi:dethiobiotin synthase [Xylophilus rhododendri]|uniref:ATP-dependent dethiobiotin synthetase BioD n=1 Tax=Xylophilus rhododendri TaxID=2697032 RepID=A0A857IYA2_9BURK|nr:dethiobiotin synthase [Xylophilus rhododendri]QHI96530.1 dethiobiotin synthase [Xylophilus rhododendri]
MNVPGCFVTGTDTEVGKTRVSAALLHLLGADGSRTAALKPVAAGLELIDGRWVNDDVQRLRAAASVKLRDAEVGPCQLRTACAPHVAAAIDDTPISRSALLQAAKALEDRCDWLVVEGVGGFRVPLGPDWDTADLAVDIGLPVILVVGLRLGCINHALLTAETIEARGLRLAGWVGTRIDATMLQPEDTIHTLRQWLQDRHAAPCLGVVPWLDDTAPAAVAAHLDAAALRKAISKNSPKGPR